ncbi:hypothetical protein M422DRAFT_775720 [Sphaerobolus stellatus SS14]|nr:hypothetical protein M422DRAFT_775720 [Sphaerobolus stellatus SS14]
MLDSLPPELLSYIIESLLRDSLFVYFDYKQKERPWNGIYTLAAVSRRMRDITHSTLVSTLPISLGKDEMLNWNPVHAMLLARKAADAAFLEASSKLETRHRTQGAVPEDSDLEPQSPTDEQWRVDSPLLALYCAIYEVQRTSEAIYQNEMYLRHLADLPRRLVDPMERTKVMKDKRLIKPALLEGAMLISSTSFVGQLAAASRFFTLVDVMVSDDPNWVHDWFDNIARTLACLEELERSCTIPLKWADLDFKGSDFVRSQHVEATDILPVLRSFIRKPVIATETKFERWRTIITKLLEAWSPPAIGNTSISTEGRDTISTSI